MIIGAYVAQDLYVSDLTAQPGAIIGYVKNTQDKNVSNNLINGDSKPIKPNHYANQLYKEINQMPEANILDVLIKKVVRYRTYLTIKEDLGSAFIHTISGKSLSQFFVTYFSVYVEYLFSPFIFQVHSFLGLLAYLESLLRLCLFISAIIMVKRRPEVVSLFLIYIAITSMWAVGVVSYGSSIRHHVMTNWILVLLGVPIIIEYMREKLRFNKVNF